MNYLGHIFLSGNDEQIMTGNFIGDYVKGQQVQHYPDAIKQGIIMHRSIDYFTDNNQHWQKIRELLRPAYGRYAGVVADLFTDYVLAHNWNTISNIRLDRHSKWAYASLLHNYNYLPDSVKGFLPYLIQHKRLQSYATFEGIATSLKIMSIRTSLPDHTIKAMTLLHNEHTLINNYGMAFLNEVCDYFKLF